MGQTYDFNVAGIPDLMKRRQALVGDPGSDVPTAATAIAQIIDILQAYGMMATA